MGILPRTNTTGRNAAPGQAPGLPLPSTRVHQHAVGGGSLAGVAGDGVAEAGSAVGTNQKTLRTGPALLCLGQYSAHLALLFDTMRGDEEEDPNYAEADFG